MHLLQALNQMPDGNPAPPVVSTSPAAKPCPKCNGLGLITWGIISTDCPRCEGSGIADKAAA